MQTESAGRVSRGSYNGIVFVEGRFRWDGGLGSGTYTLDAANKTVDYTDSKKDGTQGPVYFGRYEITAGRFRDCFTKPGKPRPIFLGTRRGDGVTCIDYVRETETPAETPSPKDPGTI